ncbi:zinc finger protein [Macleaya cordata]|uniref:Zinc finger protein n=1 Tax=Macleaya cordata TaxID=56857 RepID=A0A200QF76_MACCD|nr:zinc finger protein [Macleaya cordata]
MVMILMKLSTILASTLTNRLAKLKQCKLDAKREQWLSQVKNKGCKDESNVKTGSSPSPLINPNHERDHKSSKNLETRSRGEDTCLHDSDLEFLTNSPTNSVSGGKDSRKNRIGSSSSSSCSGSCSGSVSEEEDDGCLDDWEAVADALTADDDKLQNPNSKPPSGSALNLGLPNKECEIGGLKPECNEKVPNCRAWRPDDAFRPQSLPNLSKQYSFPMNADRRFGLGGVSWGCHSLISQPSSCPLCCEDLDLTDSSFLPCLCGFRLCLFCHKRLLEEDARCPGCRKQYDSVIGGTGINGGAPKFRLARSCSMSTGS